MLRRLLDRLRASAIVASGERDRDRLYLDNRGLNKLDPPPIAFVIRCRPARWPTREEAARARWFSPIQLGRTVTAAERTWVPAMVPWRATDDGFVTPEVLEWYARFAEGQPGVLVVEATGIRDVASGPLLRIGDDRFVPGLRTLVETVRERSRGRTRLFIQILDFVAVRRRPEPRALLRPLPRDHRLAARPDRALARRSAVARGRGRRGARLPPRRRPR